MTSFYWTCFEAGKRILRALALGIGLDEHHLLKYHNGHYNQLRLLHYPPIPEAAIEGGKFARMPAHTDWSTMTFLFQDDCGGLQVEDPNNAGEFIDVAPIPGTVVMNVGDLLMRWSNGKWRRSKGYSCPLRTASARIFTSFRRLSQINHASRPTASSAKSILRRQSDDESTILDTLFYNHGPRSPGRVLAV